MFQEHKDILDFNLTWYQYLVYNEISSFHIALYYIITNLLLPCANCLTHCGRVTHICIGKLTIVGSDNGLSPEQRQAIIWTNAGILLIGHLGTNFNKNLIEILTFFIHKNAIESVVCEMAAILPGPQCVKACTTREIWRHLGLVMRNTVSPVTILDCPDQKQL